MTVDVSKLCDPADHHPLVREPHVVRDAAGGRWLMGTNGEAAVFILLVDDAIGPECATTLDELLGDAARPASWTTLGALRRWAGTETPVACAACGGSGVYRTRCRQCDGSGTCYACRCNHEHECGGCAGAGEAEQGCSSCEGQGKTGDQHRWARLAPDATEYAYARVLAVRWLACVEALPDSERIEVLEASDRIVMRGDGWTVVQMAGLPRSDPVEVLPLEELT